MDTSFEPGLSQTCTQFLKKTNKVYLENIVINNEEGINFFTPSLYNVPLDQQEQQIIATIIDQCHLLTAQEKEHFKNYPSSNLKCEQFFQFLLCLKQLYPKQILKQIILISYKMVAYIEQNKDEIKGQETFIIVLNNLTKQLLSGSLNLQYLNMELANQNFVSSQKVNQYFLEFFKNCIFVLGGCLQGYYQDLFQKYQAEGIVIEQEDNQI